MKMMKRSEARIFHDAGNMVEDLRGNWPRPWRVQIVRKGDRYGLDDCLIHEDDVVEFWDMTNATSTKSGQFVSRYYVKTLLLHRGGLNLHGGVPQWRVSENTLKSIQTWIKVEVL